jgi:HAMP domain-containing protein
MLEQLVKALQVLADSQLVGVIIGAALTLFATNWNDRRTRRRAARQAGLILGDEMDLVAEPLEPLTHVACLDVYAVEFDRRFKRSVGVWRQWRSHLIPDAIGTFESMAVAFRLLANLSVILKDRFADWRDPNDRAKAAREAHVALLNARETARGIARPRNTGRNA